MNKVQINQVLRNAGVHVYSTVNGRKAREPDMLAYYTQQADELVATYEELLESFLCIRDSHMKDFYIEILDVVHSNRRSCKKY